MTMPIWLVAGQLSFERLASKGDSRGVENCAALHLLIAVGFSISPAGWSISRSLRSPSEYSPIWLKLISVISE